ncbi:hypothetical protein [Aeriscardovia aeriphila]|uniref:Uncharacterized protein n=1 Tax=Aeriscardovia aeriphila TaxID=218139 RepID=A0A261FAM6_9BIFI|nr:hypothetical protein [Aeriscardovia aeriphila]NYI25642.1 hypothetical protein [Aeriscardovia aeriphila]OZG56210.1 hypothetical protein AEAE_0698 [Aeriscardovia aeriphila]
MALLDLDMVVDQMYSLLKPVMPPEAREWVEDDVEANEPYSAFLMLMDYAITEKGDEYALQFFPLLEPEDREEYSQYLAINREK